MFAQNSEVQVLCSHEKYFDLRKSRNSTCEKKLPNCFMVFAGLYRQALKVHYPNIRRSSALVNIEIGLCWRSMPDEQKQFYKDEAERLKTERRLRGPKLNEMPTQLQRLAKPHIKKEKKAKRTPNSFFLFKNKEYIRFKELYPDKRNPAALNKEMGMHWLQMSDEEQRPYIEGAQALREESWRMFPERAATRSKKNQKIQTVSPAVPTVSPTSAPVVPLDVKTPFKLGSVELSNPPYINVQPDPMYNPQYPQSLSPFSHDIPGSGSRWVAEPPLTGPNIADLNLNQQFDLDEYMGTGTADLDSYDVMDFLSNFPEDEWK